MKSIKIFQVDSFATKLFEGNPAAVVPLDSWLDDKTLLNIAAENNLSETAFFVKDSGGYHIRWFTPESEIDLCGHATLAAAYVIFNFIETQAMSLAFASRSGVLKVTRKGEFITLDFPAEEVTPSPVTPHVVSGLGATPIEYYPGKYHMAVFSNAEEVRNIMPNFEWIKALSGVGIIVTAPGESTDFVSRFFAPQYGIPEDPVTGAAHCYLTPYWAGRLGKKTLTARQLSKRGGDLSLELAGDRVLISGTARLYMEGRAYIE